MRLNGVTIIIVLGLLHFLAGINRAAAQSLANTEPTTIPYAVEGSTLGARVERDSKTYRAYQCSPSEQFVGFTWCNRTSNDRGSRGRASYSILHSADGTIVYANRTSEPAFSSSEAKEEVQRIAQKYAAQPRIIEMPPRSGFSNGLIAVWGDVVLQPVDENNISQLAAGKTPKLGFMVDFIADFQRSAKLGLPIYRIGGGAGSIWVASFSQSDRGTLRFIAVDASRFASPPPAQALTVAQPSPAPDQAATAAQPSSQPTDNANESEAKRAELKQTIETLKADLASSATKIARLESQVSETERVLKQQAQARINADSARRQIEQTITAERNAAYGAARFRLLQIVGYIVIGSVMTLLLIAASVYWIGFQLVMKSDSAKAEEKADWLDGSFGRELEKHVAQINAIPSNTPA
jgi:hypothetical protein